MTFWDALWFIDTVTASIEYLCPGHLQHPTMTMMKTKNTFVLGLNFKRMLRKKKNRVHQNTRERLALLYIIGNI